MKIGKRSALLILCLLGVLIWGGNNASAEKSSTYSVIDYKGVWAQSSNGLWWYRHFDGSYTKNDWEFIEGKWYYFNAEGWMHTGWLNVSGTWYYLKEDGSMFTGWLNSTSGWYYFSEDGSMRTGWLNVSGTWYYLNTDGKMHTGWLNVNGTWYYLKEDGSMFTGWLNSTSGWYYFSEDGSMCTDWLNVNGRWYYLHTDGKMHTGWLLLGGRWYLLDEKGAMVLDEIWDGDASYYTFDSSGVYLGKYQRSYWGYSTYTKVGGVKKIIYNGSSRYMGYFNQAAGIWNSYKPNVIINESIVSGATIVSDYTEVSSVAGVTSAYRNHSGGSIKFNDYQMKNFSAEEKLNVVLHELGHGLGLDHNQKSDVLYSYVQELTTLSFNDKKNYDYSYRQ
jgi:glucan-binding YG repeat protein